jgi:hypothetical protein
MHSEDSKPLTATAYKLNLFNQSSSLANPFSSSNQMKSKPRAVLSGFAPASAQSAKLNPFATTPSAIITDRHTVFSTPTVSPSSSPQGLLKHSPSDLAGLAPAQISGAWCFQGPSSGLPWVFLA